MTVSKINAGELRARVTIKYPAKETDTAGEPIKTWTLFAGGIPASVRSAIGRESRRGEQVEATIDYVVKIRYLAITHEMRIYWGSTVLEIVRINDRFGDKQILEIECNAVKE